MVVMLPFHEGGAGLSLSSHIAFLAEVIKNSNSLESLFSLPQVQPHRPRPISTFSRMLLPHSTVR
jgi:hypothetical protein